MAVRPLVTTGVALLSAGALVAGTPALFVPHDEITVAASTAEAPTKKTLTEDQINLLAFSLQGAWQAFTQGYGGYYYQGVVTVPTAGYVKVDDKVVVPGENTPATTPLVDSEGNALYKDVNGTLVPATVGDMGDGVQFYDAAGNESAEYAYAPGDCSATGAVCKDGFTGLAYYASQNFLPFLGPVDDIFFEAGFTEFAYIASYVAASLVPDPTGRLDLPKRVDEFFSGGVATVVGSILNDNLPDGGFAQNLSNSFFFGYGENTGITAAVTYIVDAIAQGTVNPNPTPVNPLLATLEEETAGTELVAETDSVSSTALPSVSKLLSLPTPKVESPLAKLAEKLGLPAESTLVKDVEAVDESTVEEAEESGTETTTPAVEVSLPEAPEVKAPKLPELKLPTVKLPELKTEEVETEVVETEVVKTEVVKTETVKTETATTDTTAGNKVEPTKRATERKKSAGEKFVENATKNLENAFKPKTKAGKDAQAKDKDTAKADAGSADNGSDSDSGSDK
ncbi:hypothetical protein [Mycolicibacterium sp. HK-90]|uniref:hypothetical protein n=1 Tax=Mycolicibacterium sp. HK-90 TaxID=3056937 RepID=UPI00265B5724|nr:hypothetical protein [Mycolicibacterium sp. HK-90]WKG02418.1 hypothetical protein QU592_24890 [Mycolicibacterium sp. HK-90]